MPAAQISGSCVRVTNFRDDAGRMSVGTLKECGMFGSHCGPVYVREDMTT